MKVRVAIKMKSEKKKMKREKEKREDWFNSSLQFMISFSLHKLPKTIQKMALLYFLQAFTQQLKQLKMPLLVCQKAKTRNCNENQIKPTLKKIIKVLFFGFTIWVSPNTERCKNLLIDKTMQTINMHNMWLRTAAACAPFEFAA